MINNIQLIETIINRNNADNKANLIKDALTKPINSNAIEAEYLKRKEVSEERFNKQKAIFDKELEIYNNSNYTNSEIVLDKHTKSIITKLEALGF